MFYSDGYIEQIKKLHKDKTRPRGFGGKVKDLGQFYFYLDKWNPNTLLDYGCGKGIILSILKQEHKNIIFSGYDPAVIEYATIPNVPVDCVFSNDVLEHIEPQYIDNVIQHINSLAKKNIWLRIDTMPARKFLPDGRNAHLILQDSNWWTLKLNDYIHGKIVYNNLNKKGKLDIAIEKENNGS